MTGAAERSTAPILVKTVCDRVLNSYRQYRNASMTISGNTILLILIFLILLAVLIILIVLLARTGAAARDDQAAYLIDDLRQAGLEMLDDTEDNLTDRISLNVAEIRR